MHSGWLGLERILRSLLAELNVTASRSRTCSNMKTFKVWRLREWKSVELATPPVASGTALWRAAAVKMDSCRLFGKGSDLVSREAPGPPRNLWPEQDLVRYHTQQIVVVQLRCTRFMSSVECRPRHLHSHQPHMRRLMAVVVCFSDGAQGGKLQSWWLHSDIKWFRFDGAQVSQKKFRYWLSGFLLEWLQWCQTSSGKSHIRGPNRGDAEVGEGSSGLILWALMRLFDAKCWLCLEGRLHWL